MTGRMYNERLGRSLRGHLPRSRSFPMNITPPGVPRAAPTRTRSRQRESRIAIYSFVLGASFMIFITTIVSGARAAATANSWRANTMSGSVVAAARLNFDGSAVVGGPYEYGVPGARHACSTATRSTQSSGAGDREAGH